MKLLNLLIVIFSPVKKHIPELKIPKVTIPSPRSPVLKKEKRKTQNKKIQTLYRESSVQTIPWQPPDYVVLNGDEPELLMLDFLKWGT